MDKVRILFISNKVRPQDCYYQRKLLSIALRAISPLNGLNSKFYYYIAFAIC
jgi:hypothetical protein